MLVLVADHSDCGGWEWLGGAAPSNPPSTSLWWATRSRALSPGVLLIASWVGADFLCFRGKIVKHSRY
jgi:hypothetical protein